MPDGFPTPLKKLFDDNPEVKRRTFAATCSEIRGYELPLSRINEWCWKAPSPANQVLLERAAERHELRLPRKSWQRWRRRVSQS